ncbi:fad dependent oxidoreductase [Trichoderma arundinaceum]|uniref:Fad dependent oxidoreductase n=1 Tax=Trichoderma arundinaceum TaxID=490622 RepID=A0A395NC26_TRIAR|nr:fad dependent oxidoreductase [Trichoderma arundinaceum]
MHNSKTSTSIGLIITLLGQGVRASPSCCSQTITRDVVVIGGGASGAHAAVWLRDAGKSVILVEKADQLGGHTNYYNDPISGKVINVGVQAWMEYKTAYDFPARMNVSTTGSMQFTANVDQFIDMKTGQPVADYVLPDVTRLYPALQTLLNVQENYSDILLPGYENFPAPESIPEDLLIPFVDFVEKYGIEAIVPQTWDATTQGLGDTMSEPTIWVLQGSAAPMTQALLGLAAAAVPASGRLYDLYEAVANFLGNDVLYSTTVVSATRHNGGSVILTVQDAVGTTSRIKAKRVLLACQPTPENLASFDLDATEKAVFDQMAFTTVYAGIIRHPSLQPLKNYLNRSPAPGTLNYTVFPNAPQVGSISYIGGTGDLFQFSAVGTDKDTTESMQALIAKTIDSMIKSGVLPPSNGTLEFVKFANHGKMHTRFSADTLRTGIIQKQIALQGHRSTYYTGAAFSAPFSTVLWEYNKVLLHSVIDGI